MTAHGLWFYFLLTSRVIFLVKLSASTITHDVFPAQLKTAPSTLANRCAIVPGFKLKLGRKVFYYVFVSNSRKSMTVDECVSVLFGMESQSHIKANITN